MITLHHCPQTRSMRTLWLLHEMDVAFRVVVHPFDKSLRRPEFLSVVPCGVDLDQTRHAVAELRGQDWFESLPALQNGRVALVDGNEHFNRPGTRLVEAFEWLVGWLQDRPELVPEGFAWERL